MLSRAFEWYRIADPKPSSTTIDNRVAAANSLIKTIDEASEWSLTLGLVSGVVGGFESFSQDSPVVQAVLNAIKAPESAFPTDLAENALALRACAALALGEVLVRHADGVPDNDAVIVAGALRSGFGIRPTQKGKHLKELIDELGAIAEKALNRAATSTRERPANLADGLARTAAPADIPSMWKAVAPALVNIARLYEVNQEELNIVWYLYTGLSRSSGKVLADLAPGVSALSCGVDLANQCLLPPATSLEAIVRRGFEAGRTHQDLTERTVEKLAADWDADCWKLLADGKEAQQVARDYPVLFPLSWLCDRLTANKGSGGWLAEFQKLTRIPPNCAWSGSIWAIQAFRERASCRMYVELTE